MTRQTNNIVSFDEARRAASARRFAVPAERVRDGAPSPSRGSGPRHSAAYHERASREDLHQARASSFGAGSASGGRPAGKPGGRPVRAPRHAGSSPRTEVPESPDEGFETFFGKMGERARKAKRQASKSKADREFAKRYGTDHAATPGDTGPRAAVYKGEMGSSHRRASRMQSEAAARGAGMSAGMAGPGLSAVFRKTRLLGAAALATCAVACCLFLYAPAQQYYQELRERDRLAVERQLVAERNEAIAAEVAHLSTPEGIQDRARKEFGWVAEGEYAVAVSGLAQEDGPANFQANINAAGIKAPETWYSDVLDAFFGYER